MEEIKMLTEYKKPEWFGPCNSQYSLDIIKNG